MPDKTLYQLKITLKDSKPPIWRTVLIDSEITLDELHYVIQIAMQWENYHLHQFSKHEIFYGNPNLIDDVEDSREHYVNEVLIKEKDSINYEYDFGDSWNHKITLEKILPWDESKTYPICLKGKRAGPPEDCGGIYGYYNMLEVINEPEHPDYEEVMEYLIGDVGESYDPEHFNLEDINLAFKNWNYEAYDESFLQEQESGLNAFLPAELFKALQEPNSMHHRPAKLMIFILSTLVPPMKFMLDEQSPDSEAILNTVPEEFNITKDFIRDFFKVYIKHRHPELDNNFDFNSAEFDEPTMLVIREAAQFILAGLLAQMQFEGI